MNKTQIALLVKAHAYQARSRRRLLGLVFHIARSKARH